MPDLPTVDGAGVQGYEVTSWNGVFAPRGTPKEIVDTVNKAMKDMLAHAGRQGRSLRELGIEAKPSSPGRAYDAVQVADGRNGTT